jgi:hypothetical protein
MCFLCSPLQWIRSTATRKLQEGHARLDEGSNISTIFDFDFDYGTVLSQRLGSEDPVPKGREE